MAAGKTNWFAIWVSAAVVVVIVAVGGIVWFSNSQASSPGPAPESSAINEETGAIAVGSGPNTVDTYVDFMCPICNNFEQTYGSTLSQLADDGTITLNIHPISILDRASQGTEYSTRSANAMYCVAADDPANALPFLQALYENQPQEQSTGLDDATLTSIAEGVGAGEGVASCITDGTYSRYVAAKTRETPVQSGAGGISTPTIVVNGETLTNQTDLTGDPQADIVARFR